MLLPDLPRRSLTNPTDLFALRDGIYAADLFIAALSWLDFFTWLADHPSNEQQIATTLKLAERPLDVMLTLFSAMGLIIKEGGAYRVTRLSKEHLVKGSPWYLGPYFASLRERRSCKEMLYVLKVGKSANWSSQSDGADWHESMADPEFAASFTAAMDSRGASLAPALAEVLPVAGDETLLDIAGGSGIYACCIAAMHPEMTAAVLEKPPVDRIARQAIARRSLIDRVKVLSGDMIAEMLPSGFDVHLYSHVLHDWDEPNVRLLLAKSFLKLNPGGMVAVYDMHINGEKTGPLPVAQYSALIMHSTRGKCYSLGEMETILNDVGFIRFEYIPVKANRSLIIAYKPQ